MDAHARDAAQQALADRLRPLLGRARCVAGYVAAGAEIDPLPALEAAHRAGSTLALPHVAGRDRPLRFLRWAPGAPLVEGAFGLLQPLADAGEAEPDLILAPLLGFTRDLARIGQGAGFYDRAFAAHGGARRVGLAWSVQQLPALPLDPWDLPLHAVATEKDWIAR